MRKLLISALLASAVATPALAAPGDRASARAERQQAREDRQQAREERQDRSERREARQQPRPERVERQVELRAHDNGNVQRSNAQSNRSARDFERAERQGVREQRSEDRQQLREQRRDTTRASRQLRQSERAAPNVLRPRVPVVSNTPQIGTQPPLRTERRRSSPVNWSNHWRNDRRYDWYNWRNRNRSLFRLGFYYDPFGWGYQRYNIGWRMWPSYYGSNFWLNDPWQYRLPYAPPGYRWIRYYDDAILVDTWDGRVVDVIHNFFW